jgi:PIN domain nuclease of toxin-antitoxin system
MIVVLLDTHAWVWSLFASSNVSAGARRAIETAHTVLVAPSSFYEITAKHRLGKWPEVGGIVGRLPQLLRAQGGDVAPWTATMAMLAGGMDWSHRDPFDRMIAATAIELACPVVSKDGVFDDLRGRFGWRGRIWEAEVPDTAGPAA